MRRAGRWASVPFLVAFLAILVAEVACWCATPLVYDPISLDWIAPEGSGRPEGEEGYVGKWNLASLPNGAIEYWINPSLPPGVAPLASQRFILHRVSGLTMARSQGRSEIIVVNRCSVHTSSPSMRKPAAR